MAKPVTAEEWPVVWARINQLIGSSNDQAVKDLSRIYYKPARAKDADDYFVKIQNGRSMVVSELPELVASASVHPIKFYPQMSHQQLVEIDGIESGPLELNFEQGLKEVVNRCQFMQFASNPDNQEHISEPHWKGMISNAWG